MSVQVAIVDDHEVVRLGFAAACDKNDFDLIGSAPTVSELLEQKALTQNWPHHFGGRT